MYAEGRGQGKIELLITTLASACTRPAKIISEKHI
jgi:hypothetical protein